MLAFLLLLEAANSRSSAEIEASSCSCWLLLVLDDIVDELPGAAVDVAGVNEEVAGEVAGDLGVRLTVLPTSSST